MGGPDRISRVRRSTSKNERRLHSSLFCFEDSRSHRLRQLPARSAQPIVIRGRYPSILHYASVVFPCYALVGSRIYFCTACRRVFFCTPEDAKKK